MATSMAIPSNANKPSLGRSDTRILTELTIKSLKHGEQRTDGALPPGNGRLVMSCTKARGRIRRVWSFRYRRSEVHGELTLGEHPAISLEQARTEARQLVEMVRNGIDPKVARRAAQLAKIEAVRAQNAVGTFASLLAAYFANLRAKGKICAREVERQFDLHVIRPWPTLAKSAANSIRPEDIRDILARMVRLGIRRQTNIMRSFLQAAFKYGAHADFDPRRAATDSALFKLTANPASLLPRIQEFEGVRDRVLTDDEFRHIWLSLDSIRTEIGLALKCEILLGGQRFRQFLRATWADYDKEQRILRLTDGKGQRTTALAHYLPISDQVNELLMKLWSINAGGPFILSTTGGRRSIHATSLPSVFAYIRQLWSEAGGDAEADFQGRDIRRSIETRLQRLGVTREVRAQLLSHGRTGGVQQKHYERYDYLHEKRTALQLLEAHLQATFDLRDAAAQPPQAPSSQPESSIA